MRGLFVCLFLLLLFGLVWFWVCLFASVRFSVVVCLFMLCFLWHCFFVLVLVTCVALFVRLIDVVCLALFRFPFRA